MTDARCDMFGPCGELPSYLVYLEGPCEGGDPCLGHPCCEACAQHYREGRRPLAATRITSLPVRIPLSEAVSA